MEPNEHAEPVEIASVGDCANSASAQNRSGFGVLHCLNMATPFMRHGSFPGALWIDWLCLFMIS